ncbi:N-acyl homoserine lactonase family protein [Microcella sp.]|uniref:N-acyl homoserine lactonase family protein n=1 Tax=Microcella sp. TaxID=1913979 RepID=UPI002562D4D2|nr:N-acyl homoserine lactonase family protein [Microcella sp.]MBX9470483.1 N-acyl homoserine lactonase family protein [Microcella sp.]
MTRATSTTTHGPVRAVHAITLGEVQVRPKNIEGTGTPMLWWTLTARTWSPWLPVLAFVIEHERGTVLFDTGQSPDSLTDPGYYPGGMLGWVYRRQARFRVPAEQTLTAQLAALGFTAGDITHVALSHLHQDHAGNLAPFTNVPVYVAPAELALLEQKTPELHGVLAARIPPPGVTLTPVPFTDADEFDLFDDGSLVLMPTPGHSPGSMSLLIRRADAAPLLLVGDVTYDPELLSRGIVPDVGDRADQLETARRITELTSSEPTLRVLAAHDPSALTLLTQP